MNDRMLDNKVRQDAVKVDNDVRNLAEDSVALMSRFGENLSQATSKAKDDLTTWVGDEVTSLTEGIEKMAGDAKESVVTAAAAVKKGVGHGLSQYNEKAQEVADKLPGDIGKKAKKYPWVAISLALFVGFLLGGILRPARLFHG